MPRTQNTMPIMITANTGTPRFTGSYTLVQSYFGLRASSASPRHAASMLAASGTANSAATDRASSGSDTAMSTADTARHCTAMAKLTATFAPSTVAGDTGAVSMSQRAEPSSETDAAVVDEIAQKNASAHGSSAPTNGAYAGGSKSSDSIPVAEPTATATAATSTT